MGKVGQAVLISGSADHYLKYTANDLSYKNFRNIRIKLSSCVSPDFIDCVLLTVSMPVGPVTGHSIICICYRNDSCFPADRFPPSSLEDNYRLSNIKACPIAEFPEFIPHIQRYYQI